MHTLWAVLSHVWPQGEKPIVFASCTLEKLFTDRKRGIGTGMGDQTIPTIPFWKPFHTGDRTSALGAHSQPGKGITSSYGSTAAKVCCSPVGMLLRHQAQEYHTTWMDFHVSLWKPKHRQN